MTIKQPGKSLMRDGGAALGLLLITLAFFAKALSGRLVFFHEDFHGLFYPMKVFYVECLRAGRLPLWNPFIGCGYPQYAEGQIANFYPLNYPLFAWLSLPLAFNWNVILHFALGGIFFYAFLRRRGLGIGASFIGGLVFEGSAFMVGHLQHPSIFCSVIWLPLMLYCLEAGLQQARAGKSVFPWAGFAGLLLAVQILVGYPPIVFYSLMICFIYLLGRGLELRKSGLKLKPSLLLFLGTLLVGISLSTLQWLPTAKLTMSSERVTLARDLYMTGFSMDPRHLLAFIFPHFLGSAAFGTYVGQKFYWEVCSYLGLLSLCFIVLAAVKRRPQSWPFIIMALVGVLLALGRLNASDSNPIVSPLYSKLLQYVPPFNLFRAAGRYLLLWTVAGAALTGEGVQYLLDRAGEKRRRPLPAMLLAGLLLAVWVGLQLYFTRRLPAYAHRPAVLPGEWAILACGLLLFAALLWAARQGAARTFLVSATVIAIAADLFAFAKPLAPLTDPGFHRIVPWAAKRIMTDKSWYRVWPWRTSQKGDPFYGDPYPWALTRKYYLWDTDRLMSNLNIPWHMRTVPGNAAFMREVDYAAHLTESEIYPSMPKGQVYMRNLARLMGTKYLLLRQADTAMGRRMRSYEPALELVEHRDKLWLYRIPNALPRAWVVGGVQVELDAVTAGHISIDSRFDPLAAAVVEQSLPAPLENYRPVPAEIITEEPRPEIIRLHTKSERDGFLVVSEIYDPDWEATLDGNSVPMYRTDSLLRGVVLPAGKHTVEFRYDNIYITTGLKISLLALLSWGLLGLRFYFKKPLPASPSPESQPPKSKARA
jgi:hypothetical protein